MRFYDENIFLVSFVAFFVPIDPSHLVPILAEGPGQVRQKVVDETTG